MRQQINLYKDEDAIEAKAEREAAIAAERQRAAAGSLRRSAAAAAGGSSDVGRRLGHDADDDEDDDFRMSVRGVPRRPHLGDTAEDGGADGEDEGERRRCRPLRSLCPAGVAGPSVEQFKMPGGPNAQFHF